jgi:exodeoxyribonuclease VII large subunit
MARRVIDQQGIRRALAVFHRAVGRRLQRVDEQEYRLRERMRALVEARQRIYRALDARVRYYDPRPRFARDHRRLETAQAAMEQRLRLDLARRSAQLQELSAKLSQLSPLRILERGYAIVTKAQGEIVTDSRDTPPGSSVHIRLAKGDVDATVTRN